MSQGLGHGDRAFSRQPATTGADVATSPVTTGARKRVSKSLIPCPVLVLLGPTGSGKTDIAIKLARELNGEIISADSRAVYKGMDIGTAKPTPKEQAAAPHWGLDLVTPVERFTVANWKSYAERKISEIRSRGHLPIIAGGTGLYIDALIYDYQFRGPTGHRIGDIEQKTCSDRTKIKGDYLIIGISTPPEELRARLRSRLSKMFTQPLYDEVKKLVQLYGWGSGAMKGDIYEYAWRYLEGELTLDEAKQLCFYEDWHLAKRQLTWFKRNPHIIWLPLDKIYSYVINFFDVTT